MASGQAVTFTVARASPGAPVTISRQDPAWLLSHPVAGGANFSGRSQMIVLYFTLRNIRRPHFRLKP